MRGGGGSLPEPVSAFFTDTGNLQGNSRDYGPDKSALPPAFAPKVGHFFAEALISEQGI
jgi:hypothetical protein